MELRHQIFPGHFEGAAAANGRRYTFDLRNTSVLNHDDPVSAVFIGDSITDAWELNVYFRDIGLIINRGIGGDSVGIVNRRFEADVIQLKPKVCVIMIGVNDTGVLYLDPPMLEKDLLDFYRKEIGEILEKAKLYDQKMILCSIMPVNISGFNNDIRNKAIVKMNLILKEYAKQYGYPYVDYHSAFVDNDGLTIRDGLAWDGLHPHVAGYDIMANELRPAIKNILNIK